MKLKFITAIAVITIVLFSVVISCRKDVSTEQASQSPQAAANSGLFSKTDSKQPPFEFNVILNGQDKRLGVVEFRQKPDTARIVNLNTWVFNLDPHHTYLLQRAVNLITDSTHCSSTAWLTLGFGLVPHSIHTDGNGSAHLLLWRDVTAAPRGSEYYIHFQIVDSTSLAPVLTSSCYKYTVR